MPTPHLRPRFLIILILLGLLPQSGESAPTNEQWQSSQLGHIFETSQSVELHYQTSADVVNWVITDFWHKEVEAGASPVSEGIAIVRPKITMVGYYLLHATPRKGGAALPDSYTSFAIVRPHLSKDSLNSPFGVMTHFAQGMNPEMLSAFKKIGIGSIRDEHYWGQVEKTPGIYEFPYKSDTYMKACEANGIQPLIAMTFGNKLYDDKDGPSTAAGYRGYAEYGQAILNHYGKQIHWLEIWNEYNGSWCPPAAQSDRPRYYTEMLKAAYEQIKSTRPDVQVLGGAAVLIPLPYFEGIFKQGGLNFMDGVVIHPYRDKPEGVDKEVGDLKELIRKYNDGKDKPIWVTETGRHLKEEYPWEQGRGMYEKGRADGARYLPRQYTLLLKENVRKIYWYLASDHADFVSMGLLRHHQREASGMGRYAVAPSYVSYANLIHQLDGTAFVKREAWRPYTRAHVYLFRGDKDNVHVCWATQPAKIRVKSATAITVANVMGTESTVVPVNGEAVLDLSEDTIYLHGDITDIAEIDTGVRVLASTSEDYSKTQGENNWRYGYIQGESPFKELTQVETMWGYNWGGVGRNLVISSSNMHPDKLNGQDTAPVIRWTSPVDGDLTVKGSLSNSGQGDGVIASILVDGKPAYSQLVGGTAPSKVSLNTPIKVHAGSSVDFLINPGPTVDYDATSYDFTIIQSK
jgi:hypothetical protein